MKVTHVIAVVFAAVLSLTGPTSALASVTYDRAEVLLAIDDRVLELNDEIAAIQATLPGLSKQDAQRALRDIRLLTVRQMQLRSIRRVVPRFSEVRLARVVSYYDLSVSPT